MDKPNFTTSFLVDQSPETVFAAVTDVRGWWSQEIDGPTDRLGAEFEYRFRDIHRCRMRITELVPDQRVVWLVLSNFFSFTEDRTEWTGTHVVFDIARQGDRTELVFTHDGLVPDYECYAACSQGWSTYVGGSLRDLIVTGNGSNVVLGSTRLAIQDLSEAGRQPMVAADGRSAVSSTRIGVPFQELVLSVPTGCSAFSIFSRPRP